MLKNEALCGAEEPQSAAIALRAGPLELLFEPKSAWVRQVRFENREVVRAIYGAIRDRNWATVLPVASRLIDHGRPRCYDDGRGNHSWAIIARIGVPPSVSAPFGAGIRAWRQRHADDIDE